MLRSLVGSEMCIRDSPKNHPPSVPKNPSIPKNHPPSVPKNPSIPTNQPSSIPINPTIPTNQPSSIPNSQYCTIPNNKYFSIPNNQPILDNQGSYQYYASQMMPPNPMVPSMMPMTMPYAMYYTQDSSQKDFEIQRLNKALESSQLDLMQLEDKLKESEDTLQIVRAELMNCLLYTSPSPRDS